VKRLHNGRATSTLAVSLDDIKNLRQLDSATPVHPESGINTGVETTTAHSAKTVATALAWQSRRDGSARATAGPMARCSMHHRQRSSSIQAATNYVFRL
jgi:transketolase